MSVQTRFSVFVIPVDEPIVSTNALVKADPIVI